LQPAEMASLFPQRLPVTEAMIALGQAAWQAYSAATPAPLLELLKQDLAALPYLRPALAAHLERFPSQFNGLNRIEQLALARLAPHSAEFKVIFRHFGADAPIFGYGDSQFYNELTGLVEVAHPLLARAQSAAAAGPINSAYQITEAGCAVLAGKI